VWLSSFGLAARLLRPGSADASCWEREFAVAFRPSNVLLPPLFLFRFCSDVPPFPDCTSHSMWFARLPSNTAAQPFRWNVHCTRKRPRGGTIATKARPLAIITGASTGIGSRQYALCGFENDFFTSILFLSKDVVRPGRLRQCKPVRDDEARVDLLVFDTVEEGASTCVRDTGRL
jgi:hypothetical protein